MPPVKYGPRTKAERKRRSKNAKNDGHGDSNATEIASSETQNERIQRKQALRDALHAEQNGQMSSKKKKRLDKYIDKKLRKDESLELIKKLSSAKQDTSFLRSSKNLGGVAPARDADDISLEPRMRVQSDSDSSRSEDEAPANGASKKLEPPQNLAIGSGLKRPLEKDLFGAPVIRKRQRVQAPVTTTQPSDEGSEEASWDGFSSDGSVQGGTSRGPEGEESASLETDSDSNSDSDTGSTDTSEDDSGDDDDDDDDDEANELAESIFAAMAAKKTRDTAKTQTQEKPARNLADFRSWATQQINQARDFAPSRPLEDIQAASDEIKAKNIEYKPRAPEQDELPPELRISQSQPDRRAYAVSVERPSDIQEARMKLPVVAEEQKIMEAIHNNPITIVCGATGSGKTTQIPQFLFEAGYGDPKGPTPGMIAVTQPRRVAAVTMAQRVAQELGSAGKKVAHQIRYGSTVDKDTALKFMTDGILIREIASDFALEKYSAIVIDEAHERSVNTDILIGMLSRIVNLRLKLHEEKPELRPLKLIIMSATLMVKAFTENTNLFKQGTPPLVTSEGRQYPVTMHFSRRTQRDYLDEAFRKIVRGHKKLPYGAILVFLTGENEIIALTKKLKEAFGQNSAANDVQVKLAAKDAPLEDEDFDTDKKHDFVRSAEEDYESDDADADDDEDEFDVQPEEDDKDKRITDALILPLYSKLPTKEQLRVFQPPPEDSRLIVLSTNVAETSVTIPGVRYVFDCGRSKEKRYDQNTGVQSFEIDWISKASAQQRAGRAGRTGPGHCYRLYSSAVFERDFAEHTLPEVLRMPVEGVVLQLKSMDLQHVIRFPFPTPPEEQSIIKAERLLSYLGALDEAGKVTKVGRDLSLYPLSPRYAKMLAIGHQQDCMLLTIATVAALATPELFIPEMKVLGADANAGDFVLDGDMVETSGSDQRRKAYNKAHYSFSSLDRQSDALKQLSAFGAYQHATRQYTNHSSEEDPISFCNRTFLRPKSMHEASQLFSQLLRIVSDNRPGVVTPSITTIPPPDDKQLAALKQIVAVGFIDQVAIRADHAPSPPDLPRGRRATEVPYLTLFPSHESRVRSEDPAHAAVYVHASSVLAHVKPTEMPDYLIYSHLQRGNASSVTATARVRMHPLTSVTAAQLARLAKGTPLLEYGKPIGKIEAVPGSLDKRLCWVVPSLVGRRGTGAQGWPLPAMKVVQKKGWNGSWVVEKVIS